MSGSTPKVTSWDLLLTEAILARPPIDEPLPLANRPETIYGSTISFLIVTWFAVIFRLWVRFKVVREPGWDDYLVVIAAVCNTAATITVCLSVAYGGLGQHMLYLGKDKIETYFLTFYIAHSIYLTETTIIKTSLLIQYLRIFKAGRMRWLCIGMMALIIPWGIGFSILGWFPCAPVSSFWDRTGEVHCWGFGFGDKESFIALFQAHSSSNMAFDLAVLVVPLILFRSPNLQRNNFLALAGIFAVGAIVVMISIWRLHSIVEHRAGLEPYPDFMWWTPISIILSCLEIDLAIICASMPIFWPMVSKSFAAIFVSHEIQVEEVRVDNHGLAYELEHTKSRGQQSLRSSSGTSTHELTSDLEDTFKEPISVGVDPLGPEAQSGQGLQTNIESEPKRRWEI